MEFVLRNACNVAFDLAGGGSEARGLPGHLINLAIVNEVRIPDTELLPYALKIECRCHARLYFTCEWRKKQRTEADGCVGRQGRFRKSHAHAP